MSWYDDWCCIAPGVDDMEERLVAEEEACSLAHIGWTTADGDLIPYGEMQTSHLLNCKRMIERKNGWRREFLRYIEHELRLRGITVDKL